MTANGFGSTDKLSAAGGTATGTIVLDGSPPVQIPTGAVSGDVLTSDGAGNASWQPPTGTSTGAAPLAQVSVQTSAYMAAANQIVPVDTTGGNVTVTLPNGPPAGSMVAVKQVTLGGTNTVTVACAGTDVYNKTGGATTLTLTLQAQGVLLEYGAGIWMVLADDLPLTQLDARYAPLVTVPPSGDTTGATDHASLAAALTAIGSAGGGTLYLKPHATYYVNASLAVPSNTKIVGGGLWSTTVWQKGVTYNVTGTYYNVFQPVTNAANIEFRDFWIIGDNNPMVALPLGSQCDGIGIPNAGNCSNMRCERVGGSYLFGIAIQATNASGAANVEIVDCWAVNCGKDGLNINATVAKVTGCTMIGNAFNGLESSSTSYVVADNYAYGNGVAGIGLVGPPVAVQANATCHDNVCIGNVTGIAIEGNLQQWDVHDNVCRNNTNFGISVSGSTSPSNGKVHHNTCVSNGISTGTGGIGIFVAGPSVEIASNYCTDTADTGYRQTIGVQVVSASCRIAGNRSLGNISWDYDFNAAASMVLDISGPGTNTRYRGTGVGVSAGRITGAGTPLSVVPAAVGVIYQRTDGAAGTTLYVKETASGSTDSTGWVPYASAASVALKASLDSPALTGVPTAPTAAALTSNTQIATTAYTDTAVAGVTGGTTLLKANNLSDVASVPTALTNLGIVTPNVQLFTASGTWTKPAGAKTVFVSESAGGAGGGSGASGTSGTALTGGGGGGTSPLTSRQLIASDLTSTVSITVGAGGNGGASVTGMASPRVDTTAGGTNTTTTVTDANAITGDLGRSISGTNIPANAYITAVNAGVGYTISAAATGGVTSSITFTIGAHTVGNPGAAGGLSSFGSYTRVLAGFGGGAGLIAAAGTAGGPATGFSGVGQGAGAASSATGGAGSQIGLFTPLGAPGGPSGGGITSAGAASAGAGGQQSLLNYDAVGGTAGAVGGASPTSGTASAITNGSVGPGPGSGAASITGAAQAGANALANSGAGGAGGGASLNGNASGAGGNGGTGWVLVTTYFQLQTLTAA